MTQAFNLSQFANKLNSSGQTDNTGLQNSSVTVTPGTALSGGGAIALGSSATISHANSGVTANTYTAATITVNAQGHITSASSNSIGAGTVTSVATGNGLSGGTITSSGTLTLACPSANTVGSYILGAYYQNGEGQLSYGQNVAVGGGGGQIRGTWNMANDGSLAWGADSTSYISGTWKWLTRP
jgi:hypothetical protein